MKNYWSVFLFVLMLFIPFQFSILPSFGIYFLPFSESLVSEFGTFFFSDCGDCTWRIGSDNEGIYLLALLLLPLSLLVYLLIKSSSLSVPFFLGIMYLLLLYLSMQLIRYGLDKVFLNQFGFPEANLLYTPIGHMEKDILFWTSMGSAPIFSIGTGAIEVLVGLALLFKRTRLLALMASTLILFHIFFINLSFQIDVRFYSFFLFSISMLLSVDQWKTLLKAILQGRLTLDLSPAQAGFPKWIAALIVSVIFLDLSFPQIANKERSLAIPPELKSAYQCLETLGPSEIRRIFFHSRGYMIYESADGKMTSKKVYFDPGKKLIYLEDKTATLSYQVRGDTLNVFMVNDDVHNQWKGLAIDLEILPLVKEEFWLTDRKH